MDSSVRLEAWTLTNTIIDTKNLQICLLVKSCQPNPVFVGPRAENDFFFKRLNKIRRRNFVTCKNYMKFKFQHP